MKKIIIMCLVAGLAVSAGAIPGTISFQGTLAKMGDGGVVTPSTDKNVTLEFRIYDSEKSTVVLWARRMSVILQSANFNVTLGDLNGTAIPVAEGGGTNSLVGAVLAATNGLYIGVTPQDGAEIRPRQIMRNTPHAISAANASGDFVVPGTLEVVKDTLVKGDTLFQGDVVLQQGLASGKDIVVASGTTIKPATRAGLHFDDNRMLIMSDLTTATGSVVTVDGNFTIASPMRFAENSKLPAKLIPSSVVIFDGHRNKTSWTTPRACRVVAHGFGQFTDANSYNYGALAINVGGPVSWATGPEPASEVTIGMFNTDYMAMGAWRHGSIGRHYFGGTLSALANAGETIYFDTYQKSGHLETVQFYYAVAYYFGN